MSFSKFLCHDLGKYLGGARRFSCITGCTFILPHTFDFGGRIDQSPERLGLSAEKLVMLLVCTLTSDIETLGILLRALLKDILNDVVAVRHPNRDRQTSEHDCSALKARAEDEDACKTVT
jgi:hypothetical protein